MEVETTILAAQSPGKHLLPELEIYCYLLVLLFLIDQKKYNEVGLNILNFLAMLHFGWKHQFGYIVKALCSFFCQAKSCSSASIVRLKNLNRRTVDVLAARLFFYYSYSYELTGDLAEIRG